MSKEISATLTLEIGERERSVMVTGIHEEDYNYGANADGDFGVYVDLGFEVTGAVVRWFGIGRDLTDDEVEKHGDEIQSALYKAERKEREFDTPDRHYF